MSDERPSVRQQLNTAYQLPYGVARTAAAESIVRRVENHGPIELLPEALLDLLEAHTFGDTPSRSFVVFARILRLWDESPELFDDHETHRLFWGFKWVAGDAPDYPNISMSQGEALLADMERRFALAGRSQTAVLAARFRWLWHTGRPEAEAARMLWIKAENDELDDCAACVVGQQVDYLVEGQRYREAIEVAAGQRGECNLEPTRTLYALALAQLLSGDGAAAVHSHYAGRGHLSLDSDDFAPARGQEVELLARGGHLERALRRLREEHASLLTSASTPLFRLRFLLSVLAGLSAHRTSGAEPTGLTNIDAPTVADLLAWVEREARILAAGFDERSDTSYYGELIERNKQAGLAEVRLPLDLSQTTVTSYDVPAAAPNSPVESNEGPLATAERLQSQGAYAQAAAEYERAAAMAREEGRLESAGLAFAEAARCSDLADDDLSAQRLYSAGWPLLRAGGADLDVLVPVATAWAPVATRLMAADEVLVALGDVIELVTDPDLSGLSDALATRRRRELGRLRAAALDTLARTLASLPASARGPGRELKDAARVATDAAETYAQTGKIGDAAHAFWLAGRLLRDLGETDAAVWSLESAIEGFALARRRAERGEAANHLIELLRVTGQDTRADEIVEGLLR